MAKNAPTFTGSIPKIYDEGLGPVIFTPYADDIAARAHKLAPRAVIELAAGTGIVSRAVRDALPKKSKLHSTDFSEEMLEVAKSRFEDGENISFEVVDAMAIPHKDASFDMVLSQFGIMFFPDKVASLREALRVLEPGGTYLFNVWDSWDNNPWAARAHETASKFFDGNPPGFYQIPFHYHDPAQIARDLETAGFENIEIEVIKKDGAISSTSALANAAVFGNPLADEVRAREGDTTPEDVRDAIETALIKAFGRSPTTMPISALVITAKKPTAKKGFLARMFGN